MNKLTLLGLLALFIAFINCDYDCGGLTENVVKVPEDSDEEYCQMLKIGGEITHCCYVDGGNYEGRCIGLTDDQYENIVRYKKYIRDNDENAGGDDFGIDCSSKFISLSLFAVFALLF